MIVMLTGFSSIRIASLGGAIKYMCSMWRGHREAMTVTTLNDPLDLEEGLYKRVN
jgi:hypothetical protein